VTLKAVETRPAPTDNPLTRDPQSPEPEPPAIGRPVEIRSAALAVLAVLAIVMMLQYAQSAIIPIVGHSWPRPAGARSPDGNRGEARSRTNSSQRRDGCVAVPPLDSTNCFTRSLPRL